MKPRTGRVSLCIESLVENVFLVGAVVRGICAHTPLAPDEIADVELCLVEAVNNSIIHAYGSRPGNKVCVDISLDSEAVKFRIRDTGKTMQDARNMTNPACPDEKSPGGRGLFIIKSLMHQVEYKRNNDENVLTMTRRFSRPGREP